VVYPPLLRGMSALICVEEGKEEEEELKEKRFFFSYSVGGRGNGDPI
jgi:hypothetical protein